MNKQQKDLLDELVMVKNCIIYPVILDILERDIDKMKLADLQILMIYIGSLKDVRDIITLELEEVRKDLLGRGIKVYELKISESGINAKYFCRGHDHELSFLPSWIRTNIFMAMPLAHYR